MDTSKTAISGEFVRKTLTQVRQSAAPQALARSFVCRFLARLFQVPDPDSWAWLNDPAVQSRLWNAVQVLSPDPASPLKKAAEEFALYLSAEDFDTFRKNYFTFFSTGLCKLNETEYWDPDATPAQQKQRLNSLAASYRQNNLVPIARNGERIDHICFELEFVAALAAQEAVAIGRKDEEARRCAAAREAFLRDHLFHWVPQLSRRLQGISPSTAFGALARFTDIFLKEECRALPKLHRATRTATPRLQRVRAVELAH